jgi:hypothetical protein
MYVSQELQTGRMVNRISSSPINRRDVPPEDVPPEDLTGILDRDEQQYIGGGAFGDVYKGTWKLTWRTNKMKKRIAAKYPDVVVKVLRSTCFNPKILEKRKKV